MKTKLKETCEFIKLMLECIEKSDTAEQREQYHREIIAFLRPMVSCKPPEQESE
jgi:hypothetical protein